MHEWDGATPLEETLAALDHLVQSGKVRYIGASNYTAWQLMKALGVSERLGLARFVSQQVHYTLQARDIETELVPVSIDQGLGILVWSPIAGGLLSGKYRRGVEAPAGSRHLGEWDEPPVYDQEKLYDIVEVLVEVGEAHGVSAARVALAWLLARPAVTSLIVGARTEEQLADNLAAAELTLADDELARLDEVSANPLRLPVLAPGQDVRRQAEPGRPQPARPPPARLRRATRAAAGEHAQGGDAHRQPRAAEEPAGDDVGEPVHAEVEPAEADRRARRAPPWPRRRPGAGCGGWPTATTAVSTPSTTIDPRACPDGRAGLVSVISCSAAGGRTRP